MRTEAHLSAAPAAARPTAGGSLLVFFFLTYALMWACFIPVAMSIPAATPLGRLLLLLGAVSPSIVAVLLTVRVEGSAGTRNLLSGIFRWQVAARYYLFATGYMAAIKLTVALIHRTIRGAWPRFGPEFWYVIVFAILVSTPFQAGEEVGWRGYALPRMAARFGLPRAGILLGVIWACWHLPQFFIAAADTYRQSFPLFIMQVTALSVAMAWLWQRAHGSLLLTMLMHSAVNNSKDIVPSETPGGTATFGLSASPVAWVTVALLWICAAYFLRDMSRTR